MDLLTHLRTRCGFSGFTGKRSAATTILLGIVFSVLAPLVPPAARAQTQTSTAWLNYHEAQARYCKGTGGVTMGDPIDVATGAVSLSETLGTLPGRLPFTLSWGFEAQDLSRGPVGTGTYLSCDYFITTSGTYGSSTIELFTPDNHHFVLSDSGGGVYTNTNSLELLGAKLTIRNVDTSHYYLLRWKSGTVFLFNPAGALISIQDSFGNAVRFDRNASGYATCIYNQDGRKILLEYNGPYGTLSKVTLPLNRVWQFDYQFYSSNNDYLLSVATDPMNGTTRYLWRGFQRSSDPFYMGPDPDPTGGTGGGGTGGPTGPGGGTGPTDPSNPPIVGGPLPIDPIAAPIPFPGYPVYPPNTPSPTGPTNPIGGPWIPDPALPPITHPSQPAPSAPPGWETILPYLPPGYTNYPWPYHWAYDDHFSHITLDMPSTTPQGPTHPPEDSPLDDNTPADGPQNNAAPTPGPRNPPETPPTPTRPVPTLLPALLKIIDRAERTRLINTYDYIGRVIAQQTADGSTTHFTYNPGITTMTDPVGHTTTWHWSAAGGYGYNIVSVTNALGETTTIHRSTGGTNLPQSITNSRNRTVSLTWDEARGNLLSVTTPTLTGTQTTSITYDPIWDKPIAVSGPLGTVTADLDPMTGALTSVTDLRGATTFYSYSGQGDLLQVKNALGHKTVMQYTPRGELSKITDPEGRQQSFQYDDASRLLASLPTTENGGAVGWSTYYTYNDMDQVTYKKFFPLGWYFLDYLHINDPEDFSSWAVRYDYDVEGNLSRLTLPGNQKHEWDYDAMDRVIRARDPQGLETKAVYALDGSLSSVTDRSHQKTTYTYGAGGLLTGVGLYKANGALDSSIGYNYDATTHLLHSMTDSRDNSTYSWGYDALDRAISETGPQGTRSWTLDDLGRRTSLTIPGQPTLNYHYDAPGGDLSSVIANQGTLGAQIAAVTYDALGRVVQSSLGAVNGAPSYEQSTTRSFTPSGLLAHQSVVRWGSILDDRSYTYDLAGRRETEVVNGESHTFGYDPMGHLRYANYGSSNGNGHNYYWSYDTMGNRRRSGGDGINTDYEYDLTTNRLLSATRTDATTNAVLSQETGDYDTEGNLTRWGDASTSTYYNWNVRGELVGVSGGGSANSHVGTFGYDAFGRRKGQFGETIPAVWDGWGDANPFNHELSPDKVFDPAGSLLATLGGVGNPPVSTQSYLPYGEPVNSSNGSAVPEFAGMYGDPVSGLYYARNRYYHPGMGRFISEDPIGLAGGANLYAYCGNDPINFIDPLGLSATFFGMEFDREGVEEGLKTGGAAVLAAGSDMVTGFVNGNSSLVQMGLVPPMPPLYDGGAYKCKPGFGVSRVLGRIGLEAGLAAATLGESGQAEVGELWGKAVQFFKGGGGCFVAGTPVLMADGSYKPIEQVKETDKVMAHDTVTGTGRTEGKQVTSTSVREVDSTLLLGFNTGAIIETTDEHPIFEAGKGFVPAKSLGIGSEIVTRAGPNLVVTSIEHKHKRTKVYNFTVGNEDESFHSYFVGDPNTTGGGVWVHNIECTKLAQQFLRRSKEGGEIWRALPKKGIFLPNGQSWHYHDVVRIGETIVDKMSTGHWKPIPLEEWKGMIDPYGTFDEFVHFGPK